MPSPDRLNVIPSGQSPASGGGLWACAAFHADIQSYGSSLVSRPRFYVASSLMAMSLVERCQGVRKVCSSTFAASVATALAKQYCLSSRQGIAHNES